MFAIFLPRFLMKAEGPQQPEVSIAMGTKWKRVPRDAYLIDFSFSPAIAAAPAIVEVDFKYEGAKVSLQVKSQMRGFPEFHGMSVSPSGYLPSS